MGAKFRTSSARRDAELVTAKATAGEMKRVSTKNTRKIEQTLRGRADRPLNDASP